MLCWPGSDRPYLLPWPSQTPPFACLCFWPANIGSGPAQQGDTNIGQIGSTANLLDGGAIALASLRLDAVRDSISGTAKLTTDNKQMISLHIPNWMHPLPGFDEELTRVSRELLLLGCQPASSEKLEPVIFRDSSRAKNKAISAICWGIRNWPAACFSPTIAIQLLHKADLFYLHTHKPADQQAQSAHIPGKLHYR